MTTNFDLTLPNLAFVAATRAVAGAGVGLLAADHLDPEQRKTLGRTLLAIGMLTTLPILIGLWARTRR